MTNHTIPALLRRSGLVLCSAVLLALGATGCRNDMHDQPRFKPLTISAFYPDSQSSRPMIVGTVPRGGLRIDQQMYAGRTGRLGQTQSGAMSPQNSPGQNPATQQGSAAAGSGVTANADSARGGSRGAASQGVTANTGGTTGAGGTTGTGGTTARGTGTTPTQAQAGSDPAMKGYSTDFPFAVTRDVLRRGEARYNVFCSPCHGRTGTGNGMIVQRGFKAPPSFHESRLQAAPAGYFFDVITNGFGVMYPYGSRISPEDRWKIVAYIRALQLSQNASVRDLSADDQQNLERRMK